MKGLAVFRELYEIIFIAWKSVAEKIVTMKGLLSKADSRTCGASYGLD